MQTAMNLACMTCKVGLEVTGAYFSCNSKVDLKYAEDGVDRQIRQRERGGVNARTTPDLHESEISCKNDQR